MGLKLRANMKFCPVLLIRPNFCPCVGIVSANMIKLFSVKQKQKEAAESANGRIPIKKQSAGELRVQKGTTFTHLLLAIQHDHIYSECTLGVLVDIALKTENVGFCFLFWLRENHFWIMLIHQCIW